MTVYSAETSRILLFRRSGYTVIKNSIKQNPSLQQWPPSHGNVDRPHTPVAILSKPQVTALIPETATDKPALASGPGETDAPDPVSRSPARYLWATLIARLFELLPLTCPDCGAETSCNGLE